MTIENPVSATAFAPASVGNVAVGFDVLGHSVQAIGDRVTVKRIAEPTVRIAAITGVVKDLPLEPEKNTAGMAVLSIIRDQELDFGFEVTIEKGIPLGSGLGGSAVSAVAAYASGQVEFVTLVEDFRTLLAVEVEYEVERADRIRTLAALEALTGRSFVEPGGGDE